MSNNSYTLSKRKVRFNYNLYALEDLLRGYLNYFSDSNLPAEVYNKLNSLLHDLEFKYNSSPKWLDNYDIEDIEYYISYTVRDSN